MEPQQSTLTPANTMVTGKMAVRLTTGLLTPLLIVLSLAALPVSASVQVTESVKEYSVQGTSAAKIRRSLNISSPVTLNGRKYDAYTRWHVTWNFSYFDNGSLCTIENVAVQVTVDQILPRLDSSVPPRLQKKWNHYLSALKAHENGHRDIGIRAGRAVESSLQRLTSENGCSTLPQKADALGRAIINQHIAEERKYDIRTNHGARDGALFP